MVPFSQQPVSSISKNWTFGWINLQLLHSRRGRELRIVIRLWYMVKPILVGLNFISNVIVISSGLPLATIYLHHQQNIFLAKHPCGVRRIEKLCHGRMVVMFIPKDQEIFSPQNRKCLPCITDHSPEISFVLMQPLSDFESPFALAHWY